jgi:Peptidase family M28
VLRPLLLSLILLPAFAQEVRITLVDRAKVEEWMTRSPLLNQRRFEGLRELFEAVGCGPELTEQPVKGAKFPNLICRLPGEPGAGIIVIGAHFDKVKAGHGVIDNWTGAVMLPALYQALAPTKRRHTLLFVGFTDEEVGLVGSRFFVKKLAKEALPQYRAMINLDSLGAADTKVWDDHADARLLRLAYGAAEYLSLPLAGMNIGKVGNGDSSSFKAKKIPVIDFHSLTQENFPILHSERDAPEAFLPDAYWSTYRLLTGFLNLVDRQLE